MSHKTGIKCKELTNSGAKKRWIKMKLFCLFLANNELLNFFAKCKKKSSKYRLVKVSIINGKWLGSII